MVISSRVIKVLAFLSGLQLLFVLFVFLFVRNNLILHTVFGMALGLYLFWIIIGGSIMYRCRNAIRNTIMRIPGVWQIKFVVFCTLLALIEELITTAMTNAAPFFGVAVGQAYITSSGNYWDLVLGHSVILFVPLFIGWAYLLSKYDFNANQVFILFGITGMILEIANGGLGQVASIGMWMFVYGLMIYLPTYSIPANRNVKPVTFRHYLLGLFLPWLFEIILLPVIPLIHYLRPSTVSNVFPPMQSGG